MAAPGPKNFLNRQNPIVANNGINLLTSPCLDIYLFVEYGDRVTSVANSGLECSRPTW